MALKDAIAKAEAVFDEIGLPRDILSRLGLSVAQATKFLSVDQVQIQSGNIKSVDVDKVQFGDATIQRIEITDVSASLQNASVYLQNVRTITELQFTLTWKVDLGFIGSWSGSNNLGSIDIPFTVGDMAVPGLNNINMTIPSVEVPGIQAKMTPITHMALGQTAMTGISVINTRLPTNGFTMNGIGLGGMTLNNIQIPGTETVKATIQVVTPANNIVLPGAKLQNINIPSVSIPDIQSGSISTSAIASSRTITADIGILEVTLKVTPTIHLDIASMVIHDAELSALIKTMDIQNISVPVSINGVTVNEIGFSQLKVNQVTV